MTVEKQDYPKASNALVFGAMLTYIAGMLLLMSFASPYWIQSYQETFSNFKHMGLWEYCFDQFRFPAYQFDKTFDGCHYIFSQEYYVIREWLLPGWLMTVQAFVTLALMLSFVIQVSLALVLIRWPLRFVLLYQWLVVAACTIAAMVAAVLLFLSVAIFGGECWRRDWLLYPNYNYLSWSYGLAVISFFFHLFASGLLYLDARKGWEMRQESKNLVMQMYPRPDSRNNGFL